MKQSDMALEVHSDHFEFHRILLVVKDQQRIKKLF